MRKRKKTILPEVQQFSFKIMPFRNEENIKICMILVHKIGPIIWHLRGIVDDISHPKSYKYFLNVSCGTFNSSSHPEISVVWNILESLLVSSTVTFEENLLVYFIRSLGFRYMWTWQYSLGFVTFCVLNVVLVWSTSVCFKETAEFQ